MNTNEGQVTYEIRADDSYLEADLDTAEKKVKKSVEKTAEASEKVEERSSEVKKEIKEDVTKHHEEQNKKQEESDNDSHKNREDSSRGHGERLKSIATGTAKAIGTAFMAVGTASVAVGTMAVNSANDLNKAMNQFVASTGVGTEQTSRYKKVMEDIYTSNYGESFEDIGEAMSSVIKQLGDMPDEQLKQVTESAYALRDVFEYDISESTRAAKALVDNFGISGESAMNLIAVGAQNGLDYSGELLDSISEYSVQFAKVGLDADDMFKIFQQGAETGAWNLDKIGDAIKEMAIRVVDGSDTTKQGFASIGLNADKMAAKFAAGGKSAKAAFKETITALAEIKDPLEQNAAGVALFGTMWEDLGPEVVTQLADISDAAYATGEELSDMKDVRYDDLNSMFEGLKRSVEVLLIPLGEQLIPVLSEIIQGILPLVQEVLPPLIDMVMQVIDNLLPLVGEIFPILGEMIKGLLPILTELFEKLAGPLTEIISALLPPLLGLFNALLPILEVLIALLDPIIQLFMSLLQPLVDLIDDAITPLITVIGELLQAALKPLQTAISLLGGVFAGQLKGMFTDAKSIIQDIMKIFRGLLNFITGVFTGDWEKAWQGVVEIFEGLISGISAFFKTSINWIIDGINGFLEGLNGIEIPDWVPGVGGASFSIPLIPRLKKGLDFVPSDYFPAYLDFGERVLTQQENMIYTALGGVEGMQKMDRNISVTVENQTEEFDYDRLGDATAKALERAGLAVILDKREIGRVVREVQK